MNLARRKGEKCYGTIVHFLYLGTQLWQNDWLMFETPGARVDLWAEIQLNVFTSARVSNRDVTFAVFRNEYGNAEFAMQVVKDAKGMTFTSSKR